MGYFIFCGVLAAIAWGVVSALMLRHAYEQYGDRLDGDDIGASLFFGFLAGLAFGVFWPVLIFALPAAYLTWKLLSKKKAA